MAAVIKRFFLSISNKRHNSFPLNSKLLRSVFFVYRHDSNVSDKDKDVSVKDAATASQEGQGFAKALEKLDFKVKQLEENDRIAKETVSKNIFMRSSGRASNEKKPKRRLSDFEIKRKAIRDEMTFSQLFRESQYVRLGDPTNAVVLGTIFRIVKDDLYIDFGGKFHCVCKMPADEEERKKDNENRLEVTQMTNLQKRKWHIGAQVLVLIKDLEMTSRFMGYDKDMTLLEADAKLLGLSTLSHIPTY